jgi:hypothetical protein
MIPKMMEGLDRVRRQLRRTEIPGIMLHQITMMKPRRNDDVAASEGIDDRNVTTTRMRR